MKNIKEIIYNHILINYSRKLIFISLIFITSCVWGAVYQSYQPSIDIHPSNYSWVNYFIHNIKQSTISFLLGIVTYGILSIILLVLTGISIGIGIVLTMQNDLNSTILTAFLPHALFEIPAIILTCLSPFIFWRFLIVSIKHRKIQYQIIKMEALPVLSSIIILLFIASIMESIFSL